MSETFSSHEYMESNSIESLTNTALEKLGNTTEQILSRIESIKDGEISTEKLEAIENSIDKIKTALLPIFLKTSSTATELILYLGDLGRKTNLTAQDSSVRVSTVIAGLGIPLLVKALSISKELIKQI